MTLFRGKYIITGHDVTESPEGYVLTLRGASFPGGTRMEHGQLSPLPGYAETLPTRQQAEALGRHIEYWYGNKPMNQ